MKTPLFLILLLGLQPLAAQETGRPAPLPPTALESLAAFKVHTGREKVTGLVEVRGTAGAPTPLVWNVVAWDPRSPTKLEEFSIRGPRVEDRGSNREYYPDREPSGFFDLSSVKVDCAGAFRIADREAGTAMVGFDVIDYRLRCRELSDEPVWILSLRTTAGLVRGTVTLSAKSGKVLRTVWRRPGPEVRALPDDSAVPPEFRPAPPPIILPDPFPVKEPVPGDPAAPVPPVPPVEPEGKFPPPPPLPPPGTPPPIVIPD